MHSLRHSIFRDDLDDVQNSLKLVVELSDESIVNSGLVVPSVGLGLIVSLGVGEVTFSLGSEVGGFDDFVVGGLEFGGVFGNSLVALVEGGLADTHEVGKSGNLVLLILMSVSKGLVALVKDVLEHTEDSLDGRLVGEVLSQSEHDLDHLGPFGSGLEMSQELLDVVLGFGNLYE